MGTRAVCSPDVAQTTVMCETETALLEPMHTVQDADLDR